MGIITISRGSYSKGKEVAEKLAAKLDYRCISRDVLLEASEHFNIPEVKLIRALHDAPTVLDRFTRGKEKYVTFIREAFLEDIQQDNIIYHGLAGHFFIQGVPNILKVRIVANLEDRVREEMHREKISDSEARYTLKKDDEERRKWGLALYGKDTADQYLYDLVVHIDNLTVDDAVELLAQASRFACFQTSEETRQQLQDMHLAAKCYSVLIDKYPTAKVKSNQGVVVVSLESDLAVEARISQDIESTLKTIKGVKEVRAYVIPF